MLPFGSDSEKNGGHDVMLLGLSFIGTIWYIGLWCIGFLGCYVA